jgi:hypothetical protein
MSNEFEKFIQNNRESFDDQTPDPAVLERIHNQMTGGQKNRGVFISMNVIRWAAACLLLVGAGTFLFIQKNPAANVVQATKTKETKAVNAPDIKIAAATDPKSIAQEPVIEEEPVIEHKTQQYASYENPLSNNRQVMFAKLNNSESPSQRIMGAEQAYKLQKTDKDIVDVLIKTMNSDPNTNVRLAALDALSRFNRIAYVKQQLISALKIQKDPMVQIGLIQLLTGMKQTIILNDLEKIANDDTVLKEVRDQAYSSIFLLES